MAAERKDVDGGEHPDERVMMVRAVGSEVWYRVEVAAHTERYYRAKKRRN